jgi:ABC-type Fe3+/spermidine/putrescine transport system ATPase subunit
METPFSIRIVAASRRFGDVAAVDGVSLDVRRGEFFSLLGPSGCGKTTLLRMIAGLERADAGTIVIDGVDVTATPAHRRPVNLVFQHFALFPHLTVERNVTFGLRYKAVPRSEWRERAAAALELVQLAGLQNRYPDQLSGGQKQRVALARTLLRSRPVLLLDEPFSALDDETRKTVRALVARLTAQQGWHTVLVSHHIDDIAAVAQRHYRLVDGRLLPS